MQLLPVSNTYSFRKLIKVKMGFSKVLSLEICICVDNNSFNVLCCRMWYADYAQKTVIRQLIICMHQYFFICISLVFMFLINGICQLYNK